VKRLQLEEQFFFDNKNGDNSFYIHGAVEENIGKIIALIKTSKKDDNDTGKKKLQCIFQQCLL